MTDYSKPIGWWCPTCGDCAATHQKDGTVGLILHKPSCTDFSIPRFDPIPADERPEADEPDDDTVVRLILNGEDMMSRGRMGDEVRRGERWAGRAGGTRYMTQVFTMWLQGERRRRGLSLADAVLWVAEGVRP